MKKTPVLLIPLFIAWGLAGASAPSCGQALLLSEYGTGETLIEAGIGDTLDIEILAKFGRLSATGFSLYVTVPEGPFELIDQGRGIDGNLAPFRPGPSFADALEVTNCLLPYEQKVGVPQNRRLLHYTAVQGPGAQRARSGDVIVAMFSVLCRRVASGSPIGIFSSPVHETQMVMSDGSQRLLLHDDGIHVNIDVDTSVESITWGLVKELSR